MKWTVFDLEFTELLPDLGQPLQTSIHIACASVMSTGDVFPQVWYEFQSTTLNCLVSHSSYPTSVIRVDEVLK